MARKRTTAKQAPLGKQLPIRWVIPEGFVSLAATNLVVQHTEHEFVISFFQVPPPILLGEPEEIAKTVEAMKEVEAHLVARIIVASGRMGEFVTVLTQNFERFKAADSAKHN